MVYKAKRRAKVPVNAVGVMKKGKSFYFVVKGKKVPKSLLKPKRKKRRRKI
mgnify:CR=1 FL=1|jgi:hypothetical protein